MSGVEWLACADPEAVADVAQAASSLGAGNKLEFVHDVDELRRRALDRPGTVWALVGCLSGGVSDVNAAAAIAADGVPVASRSCGAMPPVRFGRGRQGRASTSSSIRLSSGRRVLRR